MGDEYAKSMVLVALYTFYNAVGSMTNDGCAACLTLRKLCKPVMPKSASTAAISSVVADVISTSIFGILQFPSPGWPSK